ncbi:MAG: sigma-70 family RNA polymerase sigma factor [Proteiniphilum sp.]
MEDRGALLEIIRKCSHKDSKSEELLYKQFFGYALSIALAYCINKEDAMEVVHDGFIKIFSNISRYDPTKSFRGWFRAIIVNTAIDHVRKEKKEAFLKIPDSLQISDDKTSVISDLTVNEMMRVIHHLPMNERMVFLLYETEGFSHEEIANKLSVTASSSRVYLARAKKRLREMFPIYFDITHG